MLALALCAFEATAATDDHDFELYDLHDRLVDLHQLRQAKDTRVIALDFFQVDCVPCKDGLAEWKKLHKRHRAEGLKVVIVALTGGESPPAALQRLIAFFDKNPMPFPVVFDKYGQVSQRYGVAKDGRADLPQAFVLDRAGRVVASGRGPGQVQAAIRKGLAR